MLDDDAVCVDSEQFVFGGIGVTGTDLVHRSCYEVASFFDNSDYLDVFFGLQSRCSGGVCRWEEHRGVLCGDIVDVGPAVAVEDACSCVDVEESGDQDRRFHPLAADGVLADFADHVAGEDQVLGGAGPRVPAGHWPPGCP